MSIDSDRIAAIDERTKYTAERVDEVLENVRTLNRAVFQGNGKESLMTRMSLVEDQVGVLSQEASPDTEGEDKIEELKVQTSGQVTIEKWRFAAVILVAIIGSGVFDAVVNALTHKP